jgi:putative DNA primase/helicase
MSDLTEHARGRWDEIHTALGTLSARLLSRRPGPCPICGGVDRFHYTDRDGLGLWHCRGGCGKPGGDGFDLIQALKGIDFPRAAKLVEGGNLACEKIGLSTPAHATHKQ